MFPHFLCIGAQKAGTTWLYQNLKLHPQIWFPPVKELHYFDHPHLIPYVFKTVVPQSHGRRARKALKKFLASDRNSSKRQWLRRYLFYPRNADWYSTLFLPEGGQIAGEVTPNYAALNEQKVAEIHALMPQAKIIYLLRNPIDRTWSEIAMYCARQGYVLGQVDVPDLLKYLNHPSRQENSDYFGTLQKWEKYYPPNQILIRFYDQLVVNPQLLLREIWRFLAIEDCDQYMPDDVNTKRNSRSYPDRPQAIEELLIQRYVGQIQQLHQKLDSNYTAQWLRSYMD